MNGLDLLNYLKRFLKDTDVRLFCMDQVWDKPPANKAFFVYNTDYCTGIGEHYVSLAITGNNVKYFDSLGFPPMPKHLKLFKMYGLTLQESSFRMLQNPITPTCGYFTICWAVWWYYGFSIKQFCNHFAIPSDINDAAIVNYFKQLPKLLENGHSR